MHAQNTGTEQYQIPECYDYMYVSMNDACHFIEISWNYSVCTMF